MKNTPNKKRNIRIEALSLGILCAIASFGVGAELASDMDTIERSSALDSVLPGDLTGDNSIDERDIIVILEIAQGYRPATMQEMSADPNDNGRITVDDALRVLHTAFPQEQ